MAHVPFDHLNITFINSIPVSSRYRFHNPYLTIFLFVASHVWALQRRGGGPSDDVMQARVLPGGDAGVSNS